MDALRTAISAWGAAERALWLSRQTKQRSYETDVVKRVERLAAPAGTIT